MKRNLPVVEVKRSWLEKEPNLCNRNLGRQSPTMED
jgi:hypothetical protein